MSKKLVLISGPTASGKSSIAISIAKKINGEIINADSMQIYKEFSILSSRPSKLELKKIKHHLYGFLSVEKYFSVGEWVKLVKKKVIECNKKNKIPILVGGTGLYFNAITNGISRIPGIDSKIRQSVRNLHKKIGQVSFYKRLISIDPLAKKKIQSADTQRAIRAYEVKVSTKKSLYEWSANTQSDFLDYDIKKIFLNTPRDDLLKKISKRTKLMFKNKCVNEVKNFLKLNIDKSLSSNKLIGVKEISDYLSGVSTLEQTQELINVKTRQYAKRQLTWSRGHMKIWNKLYSKDLSILTKKILKVVS